MQRQDIYTITPLSSRGYFHILIFHFEFTYKANLSSRRGSRNCKNAVMFCPAEWMPIFFRPAPVHKYYNRKINNKYNKRCDQRGTYIRLWPSPVDWSCQRVRTIKTFCPTAWDTFNCMRSNGIYVHIYIGYMYIV